MNKTHPNQNILDKFISGELDDKHAIVVSVHTQACGACKAYISKKESQISEDQFLSPSTGVESFSTPDFSQMLDNIIEMKPEKVSEKPVPTETITIKNKSLELPTQLSSLKSQMEPWRRVGDKISYSKIDVHGSSNLYFVYFDKGAKIPEHTHEGNEFAYVIAGSFNDQSFDYVSGDFASFSTEDSHHPETDDPDGCLLLVSLDAPFVFQEGWARLLNPFRRWFF